MRYSFHGKVRATGQVIDGFIEAETASLAIDRLADKGIIGVYSVRPEPKPIRQALSTPGEAPPEIPEQRNGRNDRRVPRILPNSRNTTIVPPAIPPAALPGQNGNAAASPTRPSTVAPAAPGYEAPSSDLLKMLVDKVAFLTGKVESMMSKPQVVVHRDAPAREGGNGRPKRGPRVAANEQNSTLRDIFQNNLDLRHSLEKLASTVGPPQPRVPEAAPRESGRETNGTNGVTHGNGNGHKVVNQAQPV